MSHPKTESILNFLSESGLNPAIDNEGDILFEFEGQPLFIHPDEDDPQALKLFGIAWRSDPETEDDDDAELILALQVANDCSARHSGVKAITLPSRDIIVEVEQFYEPFEAFRSTLPRLLKAIKGCTEEVQMMMDEYEDDEEDGYEFDPESN